MSHPTASRPAYPLVHLRLDVGMCPEACTDADHLLLSTMFAVRLTPWGIRRVRECGCPMHTNRPEGHVSDILRRNIIRLDGQYVRSSIARPRNASA